MPNRFFRPLPIAILAATIALPDAAAAFVTLEWYQRDNRPVSGTGSTPTGINRADCRGDEQLYFRYRSSRTGSDAGGLLSVWLGSACDNKLNRDEGRCHRFWAGRTIPSTGTETFQVGARLMVDPTSSSSTACPERTGATRVYVLVLGEDAAEALVTHTYIEIRHDTDPPDSPTEVAAEFGETRAFLRWSVASTTESEHKWFRTLCDPLPEGYAAGADADADADAGEDAADISESGDGGDADADDDAEVAEPDAGGDADADDDAEAAEPDISGEAATGGCSGAAFRSDIEPDPIWYCSSELGASQRSHRIENLLNGEEYRFAVVTFDDYKNPSLVSAVVCATPEQVDDFWEDYRAAGGRAATGCRAVAVPASWVAVASAFVSPLWLLLRRRRRRNNGNTSR